MSSEDSLISKQTIRYEKIKSIKIKFKSSIQQVDEIKDEIIELNCTSEFLKNRLYFIIEFGNDELTFEVTKFEIDWFKYNNNTKNDSILYTLIDELYCYVKHIDAKEMSIYYNNKEHNITYSDLGYFARDNQDSINDFNEVYYGDSDDGANSHCDLKYHNLIKHPNYLMLKLKLNNMICNSIETYIKFKIKIERDCPILFEQLKIGNICITRCDHIMSKEAYKNIKYVPTINKNTGKEEGNHKPCPICRREINHRDYMFY